ncbi:hypothetical protein ACFLWR_01135 [Chloroflexota bacterium]
MTFIKNLFVGLLSFLLFLSLTIFGLAFMLRSTVLNPDFVTSELNRIEIAALLDEFLYMDSPADSPDFNGIIIDAASNIEPEVKEQLSLGIHSTYDYLLGETRQPEVKLILRNTFLNADFVTSLFDNIDLSSLAVFYINQQFVKDIPFEIDNLDEYIANAVTSAEPAIKKQIVAVSEPVFDYLLMDSRTLDAAISLEEIKGHLSETILQIFLDSPPPELAVIPRNQRELFFNQFYQDFADMVPSEFRLTHDIFDKELPADIAAGIASAEEALQQTRQYVEYFQLGYTVLLIFIVLLGLGIVLIIRDVKITSRYLGIPLLSYGAVEYAGTLIGKYFSKGQLPASDMPPELNIWVIQFINNAVKPLEIFSLSLLIGGAILIVISFVYKRSDS